MIYTIAFLTKLNCNKIRFSRSTSLLYVPTISGGCPHMRNKVDKFRKLSFGVKDKLIY